MTSTKVLSFNGYLCYLNFSKYPNGQIRIDLIDTDDGCPVCTATTCVKDGLTKEEINDNVLLIKDWSENRGVFGVLLQNGVIENLNDVVNTGYVNARKAKLCGTD